MSINDLNYDPEIGYQWSGEGDRFTTTQSSYVPQPSGSYYHRRPVDFFHERGICDFCKEESNDNIPIADIYVCANCFKKALIEILKPNLNLSVIKALKESKRKLNGESN
jgi:hypothetical protein